MTIALRTPRLLLREWRDDDREPFAVMSFDPQVMQYLLPFADRVASDGWLARMQQLQDEDGFCNWALELPGEAAFIGAVGLNRLRYDAPFTPAVEVAWRLARPFWGKGYATEAARAAIDDGFGRLHLDEVVAVTVPANSASWRVMERLGMRRDPGEDFDHPRVPEGHSLRPHVLYRIRR